ncbi:MAG: hypothetical protein ACAI25_20175, partial [Planctomycetota bacterium]
MERRRRRFGILLTAIPAALYACTPLTDRDWPWHLADFERLAREGIAPWDRAFWQDRFSYASEGDFLPVHWVFELALGFAHRAAGLLGVELVRIALVAAVFACLHRRLAKRGLGPVAASALALTVAAITRGRLIERPHLVTLLVMVLRWDQLLAFREGKTKAPWTIIPIFLVWANSHPGVVHGAIFATGFAAAELVRMPRTRGATLAVCVLGALAATLFTPYGPRLYPYLLEHRSMQSLHHVAELRPFDWRRLEDFQFLVALAVAALIVVRGHRSGFKTDPVDLLGTLGFIVLTFVAPREANLALIAIAVTIAPVLAETVREAKGELEDKDRGLHVFAWSFALVFGFGVPAWALGSQLWEGELGTGLRRGFYPVAEANWILENRPKGRLWNTNASGGYLIWRLEPIANPDWKVFTDGRQPLYTRAVNMRFAEIEERFAPNLLVLDPLSPPWEANAWFEKFQLVHFSDGGRTYLRRGGPDATLLAQHGYKHIWFDAADDPRSVYGKRSRLVVDA